MVGGIESRSQNQSLMDLTIFSGLQNLPLTLDALTYAILCSVSSSIDPLISKNLFAHSGF